MYYQTSGLNSADHSVIKKPLIHSLSHSLTQRVRIIKSFAGVDWQVLQRRVN